jgi:hypothetical protein
MLSTNHLHPSRLLAINLRSLQLRLPHSFSVVRRNEFLGLTLVVSTAELPCSVHYHPYGVCVQSSQRRINVIKYSRALIHVNVRSTTNVPETSSVSIIRVDVRSDRTSPILNISKSC